MHYSKIDIKQGGRKCQQEVELQFNELKDFIQTQAYNLGGPYRGPGIRAEAYKLIRDMLR